MSQLVKISNQSIVTEDYLITVVARILLYIALHNKGKIYVLKFKKLKRLLMWKILRYDGVKLTSKQVEKIYKMFENLKIGKKMDEGYLISMNATANSSSQATNQGEEGYKCCFRGVFKIHKKKTVKSVRV